jgi:MFS transporter, DHA2 family, multidrug resistance protein
MTPNRRETAVKPAPMTSREWLVLGVMSFTILLISLDQTVLNVALPTLVKALHPSSSGLQWIADSYTLTNAVLLILGGALGDRYGRRKMFLIGTTIFGGGSLLCALVHTTDLLIVGRAITGLGAAFLMPATLSILVATFTGHRRAQAIGIWAGVGGIGASAGPLLGGYLLQHFWWGSVFLINVPIAAIGVVGGFIGVKESRADNPATIDPAAVILSAAGLAALTYALILAPSKHWGSSTVIGVLITSAVLLAAFLWWDRRPAHPLFDLDLFKNRAYSTGIAALTSLFFAMFGVSYLLSQYIQFVQRADAFGVGLRFVPLALGSLVTSNLAARFTARYSVRSVLLVGMGLVAIGLALIATLSATSDYLIVGLAFACIGCGMGLSIAPASNAVVSSLPPDKIGAGSGMRSMVQLLGGSFGVAIIGSLAISRYRTQVHAAFGGTLRAVPHSARAKVSDQIGQAYLSSRHLSPGVARSVTTVTDHAFVSGMRLSAIIGFVVILLVTIGVAIYIPRDGGTLPDDGEEMSEARAHVVSV